MVSCEFCRMNTLSLPHLQYVVAFIRKLNVTYSALTSMSPGWLKNSQSPTRYLEQDLHQTVSKDPRFRIIWGSCRKKCSKTEFVFLILRILESKDVTSRAFTLHSIGHSKSASITINNVRFKQQQQQNAGKSCSHFGYSSNMNFSRHPHLQWNQLRTAFGSVRRKKLNALCLDNNFEQPQTVQQF